MVRVAVTYDWVYRPYSTPVCYLCVGIYPFLMHPECSGLNVANTTSNVIHRKWVKLQFTILNYMFPF